MKLGMEIIFKHETTKKVKETGLISDTRNINILAAETDRLCIVLWVRWKIQIAFALRAARRSASKVLSFSRIGLHLVPWLAEMH